MLTPGKHQSDNIALRGEATGGLFFPSPASSFLRPPNLQVTMPYVGRAFMHAADDLPPPKMFLKEGDSGLKGTRA